VRWCEARDLHDAEAHKRRFEFFHRRSDADLVVFEVRMDREHTLDSAQGQSSATPEVYKGEHDLPAHADLYRRGRFLVTAQRPCTHRCQLLATVADPVRVCAFQDVNKASRFLGIMEHILGPVYGVVQWLVVLFDQVHNMPRCTETQPHARRILGHW
jgi:hypothetical protein